MRQYFTSLQVFLAAAVAIVFFVGILWAERSAFVEVSSLENPFDETQRVNERVVVKGEEPQSWLHETGEVFMIMPGAKFNLTNQARELEEGVIFLNSAFQDQADIVNAATDFTPPFDLEAEDLSGGQVRIGPMVVSVPQGMAVLKRDLVRKEATIYAHDHAVYLALPGAQESFLIPAGYMVLVKEDRAEIYGSLFFTKLQKELDLQVLEADSLGMESMQASLLQGLELSRVWEQQMLEYAQADIVSNNRFAPDSFMGRMLRVLAFAQRYYALGFDDVFKTNYEYERLQDTLKNTYFAFIRNDREEAMESSLAFAAVMKSPNWARFFIENPSFQPAWDDFAREQRVWFYGAFPSDMEVPALRTLWGPSPILKTFADFKDNLYLYENYVTKDYIAPAREQLEFLNENFATIDFETLENKNEITQTRRQLSLLLQQDPKRSNSLVYGLYIKLVEAEREHNSRDNETDQEQRLEVAQELLFFLDALLDSNTRQEDVFALLEVYQKLEINELAETLGRSVFDVRQRETLERIKSVRNITQEERVLILEDNQTVQDIIELRDALRIKEGQSDLPVQPLGIRSEDDLIELLTRYDVQTQGINVQLNQRAEIEFYTFSQTTYGGFPLSGTFDAGRQAFTYLRLGEVEYNRTVLDSNLVAFLRRWVRENEELEQQEQEQEEQEITINPNSSAAIVQRRNTLDILSREGIDARFNQITPEGSLNKMKVEEARFEKTYLLTFEFDFGPPQRLRNIKVEFGRNVILIPDRVFMLEGLREELLEAIEARIELKDQAEAG